MSEPLPVPEHDNLAGPAAEHVGKGRWRHYEPPAPDLARAYLDVVHAMQRLQDLTTGARPSLATTRKLTALLTQAADLVEPDQVPERQQIAGRMIAVPGRGQSLVPHLAFDESGAGRLTGRVTFGRFYLGGNGAAHGGSLSMVFDEIMGGIGGAFGGHRPTRTAYLNVSYRAVTPIGKELTFEARVDREEGRKVFASAEIRDGGTVTATAEALFVALNAGQR